MDRDLDDPLKHVVTSIIHSASNGAPEFRAAKLVPHLLAHGRVLELRLLSLPVDEQELCGLVAFRASCHARLQKMLDTWVAPPMNRMRNRPPNEVRAFARRGLYSMIVDEMLVGVKAKRIALSFTIIGNGYTTAAFKVGSVEALIADVERIGLRYELVNFAARPASSEEVSDESGM